MGTVIPFARRDTVDELGACIERMIVIQMTAYPSDWSEDERREMAVAHLFKGARKGEIL